ncbi:MAG TPA: hypothetical protein OIL78_00050 [Coriobacteriaceae bacterium]|nr:hypothetical protein [Coriobacteriaceae bacterium]
MLEDIIERTKEAADSYLSQSHARMNGVQIGPVGFLDICSRSPGQLAHVHEWHLQATREAWHRASLETTYRELSDKDIEFLLAMLPDSGPSRVSEIAKRMGVASNYTSQYKRRLPEDGVIGERGRGLVGFDIPAFREFLNEKAF